MQKLMIHEMTNSSAETEKVSPNFASKLRNSSASIYGTLYSVNAQY